MLLRPLPTIIIALGNISRLLHPGFWKHHLAVFVAQDEPLISETSSAKFTHIKACKPHTNKFCSIKLTTSLVCIYICSDPTFAFLQVRLQTHCQQFPFLLMDHLPSFDMPCQPTHTHTQTHRHIQTHSTQIHTDKHILSKGRRLYLKSFQSLSFFLSNFFFRLQPISCLAFKQLHISTVKTNQQWLPFTYLPSYFKHQLLHGLVIVVRGNRCLWSLHRALHRQARERMLRATWQPSTQP